MKTTSNSARRFAGLYKELSQNGMEKNYNVKVYPYVGVNSDSI